MKLRFLSLSLMIWTDSGTSNEMDKVNFIYCILSQLIQKKKKIPSTVDRMSECPRWEWEKRSDVLECINSSQPVSIGFYGLKEADVKGLKFD